MQIAEGKLLEIRSGFQGSIALFQTSDNENNTLLYSMKIGNITSHELKIPKGALIASGESEIVWFAPNGNSPGLGIYSLVSRKASVSSSSPRGILELKVAHGAAYILTKAGQNSVLAKVNLFDGGVENLSNIDASHPIVRIGRSGSGKIVLVDPINAQFRIDVIEPAYTAGTWQTIKSNVLSSSDVEQPAVSARPGLRMFTARILAHKENKSDGSQTFVVAATKDHPNTYAVIVDAEGKELRQYSLSIPADDHGSLRLRFESISDDSAGLGFWLNNGDKLIYEGVK